MKKISINSLRCSILLSIVSSNVFAAAYQIFPELAYENPAALNSVKKGQVILGIGIPTIKFRFNGSNGPFSGQASTVETNVLPYGRFAWRLSPKIVTSLDITNPVYSDFKYPVNSIVSALSTSTVMIGKNYSPKLSYEIKPGLAVGVGFDAHNFSNLQLSFAAPPFGELSNRASGWAYGWDAGIFYALTQTTFASLSYYSQMNHEDTGTSTWGPFSTDNYRANVVLPATTSLNIIHLLSKQWVLSATLRYIQWKPYQHIYQYNTALPVNSGFLDFPIFYKNSWSGLLASRYQINEHWAVKGALEYDSNLQPLIYRPLGMPADQIGLIAAGGEYAFTKQWSGSLVYIHGFSNPKLQNIGPIGPVNGHVRINGNSVALSVTWNI